MIHSILIAMTMAAAPATAEPREAPAAAPIVQPAQPKATRYCIVDTVTGSRLPMRVCHTRGEWLDLGVDPLAKN